MRFVTTQRCDHATLVTMDDGKANALGLQMLEELHAALDQELDTANTIVLAGQPGTFCAGYDLAVIRGNDDIARNRMRAQGKRLLERLYFARVPVVAACTGHAMAAGAMLLLAADHRVAQRGNYRIGLNELSIGLALPDYAMTLARDRLSANHMQNATMRATIYDPHTAMEAGFVDEAADDAIETALEEAGKLSRIDARAYADTKACLRGPAHQHWVRPRLVPGVPRGWKDMVAEAEAVGAEVARARSSAVMRAPSKDEARAPSAPSHTGLLAAPTKPHLEKAAPTILAEFPLAHGPVETIARYVLAAEQTLRGMGIRLRKATLHELLAVNEANRATWKPLFATFDPHHQPSPPSLCVVGENEAGEVVATLAARYFDWRDTTLKREAESLRLMYADPTERLAAGETCSVNALAAEGLRGNVVFSGAAWYRPDVRGKGLFAIMPRISRALAHGLWQSDVTTTFSSVELVRRRIADQAGYANKEFDVVCVKSVVGDMRLALLWSKTEEMLVDLEDHLGQLERALQGAAETTARQDRPAVA